MIELTEAPPSWEFLDLVIISGENFGIIQYD